jgi:hypothetical protein
MKMVRTAMRFKDKVEDTSTLIPFWKKGTPIVDTCHAGEKNPATCSRCDIDNCSKTTAFKKRQYILDKNGLSDYK